MYSLQCKYNIYINYKNYTCIYIVYYIQLYNNYYNINFKVTSNFRLQIHFFKLSFLISFERKCAFMQMHFSLQNVSKMEKNLLN